jgi:hypothetical protein
MTSRASISHYVCLIFGMFRGLKSSVLLTLRQSADKIFGCGGAALGNPQLTPFPQFRIEIFCRT